MKFAKKDELHVRYGIERLIIAVIISFVSGSAVLSGLKAVGLPIIAAALLSLVCAFIGVILLSKRLPVELIGIRKRKPLLSIAWLVIALIALLQTARLSVFMLDPTQSHYSLFPEDQWYVEHCCLTAYTESTRLAAEGEKNIYDQRHYFAKTGDKAAGDLIPFRRVLNFKVDLYHYPPTFLLLPVMVSAITGGDFLDIRMLWFALSVLTLMSAIGLIIYRLEPKGRLRMIGMVPLIWSSIPILAGLQMSNVQIIVVSISIIAMILFARNRPGGGALLAMSSVAKIFPGILIIYLAAQRKFREVLWTAGFAVGLSIIALIVVGPNPFLAFIEYELPKLSSGEAFSRPFSNAFAIARNMSPFGLPLKLGWLGLPGMTLEIGRIVSYIHLFMVLILALWSGRQQPRSRTEMVSVWISLICLGSLVSPFAPANYILVPVVMLVCLNRELFPPWAAILICIIISSPFLISLKAPFLIQALCFLPSQIIAIAAPGFVLYRAGLKNSQEQKNILSSTILPEPKTGK